MCNQKKIHIVLLFLLISLLCGCKYEENNVPQMEEYNNYDEIIEKNIFIEDKSYGTLSGMVCVDEDIFIVSTQNNCVLKYSDEGILMETIGTVGKGDGEFSKPVAICEFDKEIYVANENDGRIQVFDVEGNFQNKFYVEELNNIYTSVLDIEADADNIYISVAGGEKKLLYIYIVDKSNGTIQKTGKSCMGVLGKDQDDNIYFAQSYEYIKEDGYSGYEDGESYISNIVEGEAVKLFQLPEGYSPSDVVVYNNQIYVFSRALTQIDVFELDGKYVKTVFSESSSVDNRGLGYMDMNDNGVIYLSDKEKSIIFKVEIAK